MLFQKPIIEDLFQRIEELHHEELWQAFAHCIDHKHLFKSACSEFEIYFNFALHRTEQANIREICGCYFCFSVIRS